MKKYKIAFHVFFLSLAFLPRISNAQMAIYEESKFNMVMTFGIPLSMEFDRRSIILPDRSVEWMSNKSKSPYDITRLDKKETWYVDPKTKTYKNVNIQGLSELPQIGGEYRGEIIGFNFSMKPTNVVEKIGQFNTHQYEMLMGIDTKFYDDNSIHHGSARFLIWQTDLPPDLKTAEIISNQHYSKLATLLNLSPRDDFKSGVLKQMKIFYSQVGLDPKKSEAFVEKRIGINVKPKGFNIRTKMSFVFDKESNAALEKSSDSKQIPTSPSAAISNTLFGFLRKKIKQRNFEKTGGADFVMDSQITSIQLKPVMMDQFEVPIGYKLVIEEDKSEKKK